MCRHRWLVLWLLLGLPAILWAQSDLVIIQGSLVRQPQSLERLGFQLHARMGEKLIGTLPSVGQAHQPDGIFTLKTAVKDFSAFYLADNRALARVPQAPRMMQILYQGEGWVLFQADPEALNALSSAGVHWRALGARSVPQQTQITPIDEIDQIHPFVGVILNQVSSASYQNYLQTLQNFVTRNTYNPQSDSASNWIRQTFQSFGLTTFQDAFQIGSYTKYNIVAEKLGTTQPNQVYFMTAHYDATAGLPVFPEASAPGADDDASGAAAVLECARVIAQYSFTKTVRFVIFSGNEQGLVGSADYVAGLPMTQTYLGDFNADMIGYSGTDPWPPDLVVYHNGTTGSAALAGKMVETSNYYENGFLQTILISDAQMVYSDHAPFWDRNIPAVVAMEDEAWGDDLNPFYHSVNDLLVHLDLPYAVRVMKVILASLADLSSPVGSPSPILNAALPTINDSLGNHNHQIEFGEFIYLALPVVNAGNTAAPNVNVTMAESDPYVTLIDNQQAYGNIPALDTVTVYNAFSADISDTIPDAHIITLTVTMTTGTNQWQNQIQMASHAPNPVILSVIVNDTITGNGNGTLEPGETADLRVTVQNQGSWGATNLTATLSSPSAFIVIQTLTQSFGTLAPGATTNQVYRVAAMANAPPYFPAALDFHFQVTGGWSHTSRVTLNVGMPVHQPTGPDNYGYAAYDSTDEPWGQSYNWVEIDSSVGGPGTPLHFTNGDQTLYINLPFSFYYYGQRFSEISVCSNGWIAGGHTTNTAYLNTNIPNLSGPSAMIAPFWDDLQPNLTGAVCYYYDAAGGRMIIEFRDVRHYSPSTAHETFQVILFDPAVHPTLTGDGEILFQYSIVAVSNSCTIGIEDPTQASGIQYLYNNAYAATALPIADGTAILFTTGRYIPQMQVDLTPINPPIQIPARGGTFSFTIALANHDTILYNTDVWCNITQPNGSIIGPVLGPININLNPNISISRIRNQSIAGTSPPGNYFYNGYTGDYPSLIWFNDSFLFIKLTTGDGPMVNSWANWGDPFPGEEPAVAETSLPQQYCLEQNHPNPFNATTALSFKLQASSHVNLRVYNLAGQLVQTLVDGWREAGTHLVSMDGSRLVSGIYFVRIEAGTFTAARKIVLLK